jgi:hypothetical protein
VIRYPGFLFGILQECEARFCPEGFENFIETGTLMAHTTLHASYWLSKVWTIELSPYLRAQAQASLAGRPNVTCLEGNPGDDSTDWDALRFSSYPVATARIADPELSEVDRQMPLMAELTVLAARHTGKAVVLIDDCGNIGRRNFGFAGEDWGSLDAEAICT